MSDKKKSAPIEEQAEEIGTENETSPKEANKEQEELIAKMEALQQEIDSLSEEKQELKDQLLRKSAEFENFRKRLIKDKTDSIRFANTQILNDLIDVIDNFERALISGKENNDFKAFFDGVEMIENQLVSMLDSKYGLKRFSAKGEAFDPQKHEAIAVLPTEEKHETQIVIEEMQKGYMLGERVLRHSKVAVSQPVE